MSKAVNTLHDKPSLAERVRLAAQPVQGPRAAAPPLRYLLREATYPFSPITRRLRHRVIVPKARNPQVVLLIPGFIASPFTMRYLAAQLEAAGHCTKQWKQGMNTGPTPERVAALEERVLQIGERYQAKPVLLGWSLGGMFARELAHRQPQAISKVITMGSPFSGDPRANNAWRLYQLVTGHSVDAPPVPNRIGAKPPVETVAMWSARDGVVSAECARGEPSERDRTIEVDCTHMGFSYSRPALTALLAELDRS